MSSIATSSFFIARPPLTASSLRKEDRRKHSHSCHAASLARGEVILGLSCIGSIRGKTKHLVCQSGKSKGDVGSSRYGSLELRVSRGVLLQQCFLVSGTPHRVVLVANHMTSALLTTYYRCTRFFVQSAQETVRTFPYAGRACWPGPESIFSRCSFQARVLR